MLTYNIVVGIFWLCLMFESVVTLAILYDLVPPKCNRALRDRSHEFVFLREKTERVKWAFVNRMIYF